MKISGYIMVLLFVSFVVAAVGMIVSDIESNYPEMSSKAEFVELKEKYSFEDNIKTEMEFLRNQINKFSDADTAWEKFIGVVGMVPIPFVIMYMPLKVLTLSLNNGYYLIEDIGATVGVPPPIIAIGTIALLVIIIFKLISWWHAKEKT